MRTGYPPNPSGMTGQSISQPSGPTPTLNQLLQSSGGAAGSSGAGPGGAPVMGHPRYPPPPSGGYDHPSYNVPPHSKADYPGSGWPSGPPPPPSSRPPVSYGHPPPPGQHLMQQPQQQPMYRQVNLPFYIPPLIRNAYGIVLLRFSMRVSQLFILHVERYLPAKREQLI